MAKPVKETKAANTNIIPQHLRGPIKGTLPAKAVRTCGDMSNAAYAKENGCTTRHASKLRRGYHPPAETK
jgi:hypothetical protein